MKSCQILKSVFPAVITEYFEFTDYKESEDKLEYWLDERNYLERAEYRKGTVSSYGFTEAKTVQDFPIRGRSVYLHIRRRRWYDRATGETFSYNYDNLVESGSKLSPEFVAFLKDEDRDDGGEHIGHRCPLWSEREAADDPVQGDIL